MDFLSFILHMREKYIIVYRRRRMPRVIPLARIKLRSYTTGAFCIQRGAVYSIYIGKEREREGKRVETEKESNELPLRGAASNLF